MLKYKFIIWNPKLENNIKLAHYLLIETLKISFEINIKHILLSKVYLKRGYCKNILSTYICV